MQHLYAVQAALAAVFDIEPTEVRVVSPYTGGGFGAKAYVWPHEILAAMAARVLDKPIKLVLTRAQMYSIVGYQPWMTQEVTLAAEANGTLTAIRHDVTNITAKTDDYIEFGSATSSALYRSPAISTSQRVRRGHVNLPTFMRSPIDGPGTWALGSAMDELARATGTDPLDLRLLNYADLEPATGKPWSSKRLVAAYGKGARRFGWRDRPRGGSREGNWSLGCGLADATQGQYRFPSQARLTLDQTARLMLEAGFTDIGQGPRTIFPPYLLTALVNRPPRLIYLSSGLQKSGDPDLADLQWERRRWDGYQAYSNSKLFDAVLAAVVARRWPDVVSSSVDPGWVRTKMGGTGAPGEIGPGAETQVWLATSNDPLALQSGRHFHHRRLRETHPSVADPVVQDGLLDACYQLTGEAITDSTATTHARPRH